MVQHCPLRPLVDQARAVCSLRERAPLQWIQQGLFLCFIFFFYQSVSKIFCQVWLDRSRFLTGSKDNQLMMWNLGDEGDECQIEPIPLPAPSRPVPHETGGIHALSLNSDGSALAVGSTNPNEVAVLRTDSWACQCVCVGHNDWVFGAEWVNDETLWTASRDMTVKVWRVSDDCSSVVLPGATLKHHADRVRALKMVPRLGLAATLGTDRRLAMWDTNTGGLVRSTATRDREDLIALESDKLYGLVAVGGRELVSFFDPRQEAVVHSERSPNRSMGVRSIGFRGNLMTVGGGMGRLSFYDLVAGAWMRFEDNKCYRSLRRQLLVPAGRQEEYQAVYAHNWDRDGARLFVGGGPLLLQEIGAHASIW